MEPTSMNEIAEYRQNKLEEQILVADAFINKNYLYRLNDCEVIPVPDEMTAGNIRLYKVERLTFDEKEDVNEKLVSVYSALQEVRSSAVVIIDGKPEGVVFYIGIRADRVRDARIGGEILVKSIKGNFPGTVIDENSYATPEIRQLMQEITGENESEIVKHVASVTTVPASRTDEKENFVQGIEKFIDTMIGKTYTAVMIAAPIEKPELEQIKRGYEELYSTLSAYSGQSLQYGENVSESVAQGMFESFSRSINNSVTNTTGKNIGENVGKSRGGSKGTNLDTFGVGYSSSSQYGSTKGYSSGESWSRSVVEGQTDTKTSGTNNTNTTTNGSSKTITVNYENKSIKGLMDKIEENLERIAQCEAFGLWRCAAYFISGDIQTAVVAANAYRALMAGDNTAVESTYINQWSLKEEQNTKEVLKYISLLAHPQFVLDKLDEIEAQIVSATNLISGKEIPLLMGFPQHSVTGLTVSHSASFGRNIFATSKSKSDRKIRIGQVKHMGQIEPTEVKLDLDSFTAHCFICGSTGSGKSNTTYKLLEEFYKNDVKFLVIEPAKGEYRKEFVGVPGINIFCTNPLYFRMLKINPFKFPEEIHVLEHLDRLIEIFNACWEMTAAMPAILKESIEMAYVSVGWDLQTSTYMKAGEIHYPTFDTLMKTLPEVINNSNYSAENKGNYTGALVTRVKSLANGISGQIFEDEFGVDDAILFDQNAIVDLSRVGSSETKSLIMGILVLKLNEHRMAKADETNSGLKHVTVMEEAHNLLKRCDGLSNPVLAKSVEMISNSIAEMRTYGEGFVIVDQSPGAVDAAAVRNTNTKIVMRLPDYDDCLVVGRAASLEEDQIAEIAKLGTGEAVISQNNWLEAILAQIDAYKRDDFQGSDEIENQKSIAELRGKVIKKYFEDKKAGIFDFSEIKRILEASNLNRFKKAEYIEYWEEIYKKSPLKNIEFEQVLISFLSCQNVFDLCDVPKYDEDIDEAKYISDVKKWDKQFCEYIAKYIGTDNKRLIDNITKYLLTYKYEVEKKPKYIKARNVIFK